MCFIYSILRFTNSEVNGRVCACMGGCMCVLFSFHLFATFFSLSVSPSLRVSHATDAGCIQWVTLNFNGTTKDTRKKKTISIFDENIFHLWCDVNAYAFTRISVIGSHLIKMTMTTTTTAYSILGTHSNSVNSVVVSLSFFCMVHNVLNYHRLFAGFLMVLFFEQSFVSVVVDDFYDLIRFQKFLRVVQMYRKFVSMQFSFFVFPFIFFCCCYYCCCRCYYYCCRRCCCCCCWCSFTLAFRLQIACLKINVSNIATATPSLMLI